MHTHKHMHAHTYIHSHTHIYTHTHMQILLQPLAVMRTWQSQDACVLRQCEPCKQSSWSRARTRRRTGLTHTLTYTHTCMCARIHTVGVKKKFRIPFRRTAVAQFKKRGKNGTPFVEKRPFRSTTLPF